jgi:hypothetical protein
MPRAAAGKHSPVFLAVFALFLVVTAIYASGTMLSVLHANLAEHDTRWFWASGQLLDHRADPYDVEAVQQMQKSAGIAKMGNDVVRNPPPALFLVIPLGFLTPREAVAAWFLLMAGCLSIAFLTMRSILKASAEFRYQKWYLALMCCFAPTVACVASGQTGVVILLGLVLFLRFYDRRPFWAGAALSLCALKPHLLLPFGLVLLVWIAVRRRGAVLAGAVAALVAESAVVMLLDPAIWEHYAAGMRAQGIADLYVPTLGVALRFLFDERAMWIEFVPAAVGGAWAVWYFWRNREGWNWRTHGSLLTLVSLVVAPYAWSTDNVIVLPALLFTMLSARLPRRGSLTWLLVAMSLIAIEVVRGSGFYFRPNVVLSLMWLAWYVYAVSGSERSRQTEALATA